MVILILVFRFFLLSVSSFTFSKTRKKSEKNWLQFQNSWKKDKRCATNSGETTGEWKKFKMRTRTYTVHAQRTHSRERSRSLVSTQHMDVCMRRAYKFENFCKRKRSQVAHWQFVSSLRSLRIVADRVGRHSVQVAICRFVTHSIRSRRHHFIRIFNLKSLQLKSNYSRFTKLLSQSEHSNEQKIKSQQPNQSNESLPNRIFLFDHVCA